MFRPHRLHDYYHKESHHHHEKIYHDHDNNDHARSMQQSYVSPTMMLKVNSNNNNNTSPTTTTTTTTMMNTGSNSYEDDDDDLTLGYETPIRRRRSMKRSTPPTKGEYEYKYAASPGSESRPCRTLSLLDYCQQEVVSPLSSPSLLSLKKFHYDDLTITTVPSFAEDEDEDKDSLTFSHTTIMCNEDTIMNRYDSLDSEVMMVNDSTTLSSENNDSNNTILSSKRRGSGHNRSQFLLDGNFSFESASPSSVPAYPSSPCPTIAAAAAAATTQTSIFFSSPIPTGVGAVMMIPPPSILVTPPQSQHLPFTFDCNQGDCIIKKYDEGWKTPPKPPTHMEQRRRNKAMPSMQYADLILHRLSQHHQEQEQKTSEI